MPVFDLASSAVTHGPMGGGAATLDYLADWRELKLERETWRSLDFLNQSRRALAFRRRYYADLFSPTHMTSKVSTWLPNHLIPG